MVDPSTPIIYPISISLLYIYPYYSPYEPHPNTIIPYASTLSYGLYEPYPSIGLFENLPFGKSGLNSWCPIIVLTLLNLTPLLNPALTGSDRHPALDLINLLLQL